MGVCCDKCTFIVRRGDQHMAGASVMGGIVRARIRSWIEIIFGFCCWHGCDGSSLSEVVGAYCNRWQSDKCIFLVGRGDQRMVGSSVMCDIVRAHVQLWIEIMFGFCYWRDMYGSSLLEVVSAYCYRWQGDKCTSIVRHGDQRYGRVFGYVWYCACSCPIMNRNNVWILLLARP